MDKVYLTLSKMLVFFEIRDLLRKKFLSIIHSNPNYYLINILNKQRC